MEFNHYSVMLNECIDGLKIKPDGIYVDGTLGGAGHSYQIAKRLTAGGKLIAIDKDTEALAVSKERLSEFNNVIFVHDDYKNMSEILDKLGIDKVDGILLDLGVSSYQLDNRERGFSYIGDAELDMRMNREQSLTAKEVVNTYSESQLSKIFFEYGEEKFSKKIASNIVKARPLDSTKQLADIIERSYPASVRFKGGNPCKRVFQAIRIEVNEELYGLYESMLNMARRLNQGGRMCVITFHSLEDRITKNVFQYLYCDCVCPPHQPICTCDKVREVEVITRKPITASEEELAN
ncbi:MAG: 16S rRNA (cytosine(1402)-N(4))-methyltransferase RsmH, partial [Clostridia bacterium]|nr:16S rRNA (cytosine(1402)-N(4))-methyltransferase RsmH [Clostridia bacterium]